MHRLVTARCLPATVLYQAAAAAIAVLALATFTSRSAFAADASAQPGGAAIQRSLTVFIDLDTQEMDVIPGPGRVPLQLGLRELNALNAANSQTDRDGATRRLNDYLLSMNKCPDFVVNRGHYFGTSSFSEEPGLGDADKEALIAFLKTF